MFSGREWSVSSSSVLGNTLNMYILYSVYCVTGETCTYTVHIIYTTSDAITYIIMHLLYYYMYAICVGMICTSVFCTVCIYLKFNSCVTVSDFCVYVSSNAVIVKRVEEIPILQHAV